MFIPGGCFCCEPPEDPCVLSGCTWSSTDMSDTDLTAGTAYYNPVSGVNPDGDYEITNAQETGAGNDAPCRKITIETVSAPHKPDTVYAICWKDDATHNPSTQCPLTSVSFCVESKRHGDSDSGLTDSVVFVIRQNNRIFATAAQSVGVNWKRASGTYTQNSFTEIDGAGNPDFTAAGTSIEFGFALKLLVSEDEEPLDVVMFDNLCITRAAGCGGCSPVNCDLYNTGSSLVVDSQSSGTTYSVDPNVGLPAESHKYEFPVNSQQKSIRSLLKSDVFDGQECATPSSVTVCVNYQTDVPVGSPNGNGHSISFQLRQGAVAVTFGQLFIPGDTNNSWFSHSATYSIPASTTLLLTDPVELLMTVSGGNRTAVGIVWIDNICVRAGYSDCCCGDDIAITSSVVSIPTPPTIPAIPAVAWADAVASAYNLMNSTVIVPKGTNCGGGDVSLYESGTWSSGGSSGTWRVNKKHSVIRSGASVSISSGFTINMTRVSPSSASTSVAAGITSSVPYSFSQCSVFTGATILNGGWTITGPYALQVEYV